MSCLSDVDNLKGWLSSSQLENIRKAIQNSRVDLVKYNNLSPNYIHDRYVDNGGFSPREQYLIEFANI